ncbi:Fe-S protein assembly co-chaperone HscB [Planctomycetota bacterium]|nr:Fe-S protein assembly co-chaperone HscB [Planctomycetota bacterium]
MKQDPYEIFGLERSFEIDLDALQKEFVKLSAKYHPDKYVDPIEQMDAAEYSSEINVAYQALRDDESRANALLALMGGPSKEDDKSLPPTLLMEMMEIREEMEAAVEAKDNATVQKLRQWAEEEREEYLGMLGQIFSKVSGKTVTESEGKQIRLHLNSLRYIERMLEQTPEEV